MGKTTNCMMLQKLLILFFFLQDRLKIRTRNKRSTQKCYQSIDALSILGDATSSHRSVIICTESASVKRPCVLHQAGILSSLYFITQGKRHFSTHEDRLRVSSDHFTTDGIKFNNMGISPYCHEKVPCHGIMSRCRTFAHVLRCRQADIARYLSRHENSATGNILEILFELTFILYVFFHCVSRQKIQLCEDAKSVT